MKSSGKLREMFEEVLFSIPFKSAMKSINEQNGRKMPLEIYVKSQMKDK